MSDFFQHGLISTLHHLKDDALLQLESEMAEMAKRRPIALLLPSLYSELQQPAFTHTISEIRKVPYLSQIVVSMNRMNRRQFSHARRFFDSLPQPHLILWNDGPRVKRLYDKLREKELASYVPGKGYNVWMGFGLLLAQRVIDVVVVHDCDIVNYNRELLARLTYPVADLNMPYAFCKGYYGRVTDRMHGRVTRLLMQPLLFSMKRICGPLPLLEYLSNFRYVLSGELAMTLDLARAIRIPGDWGLEVGLLAEVYRNIATRRICQSDISTNYEHKHQELSPSDARAGLHKMATDICKSLFHTLSGEGIHLSPTLFSTLQTTYLRHAQELVERYAHDAELNRLKFVRHEEMVAVETFLSAIQHAARSHTQNPLGSHLIADWNRVNSALETFSQELLEAVELDNK